MRLCLSQQLLLLSSNQRRANQTLDVILLLQDMGKLKVLLSFSLGEMTNDHILVSGLINHAYFFGNLFTLTKAQPRTRLLFAWTTVSFFSSFPLNVSIEDTLI